MAGGKGKSKSSRVWVFFLVAILIVALAVLSFVGIHTGNGNAIIKGANDIRWGIDIQGGVEVTFTPEGVDNATREQMDAASEVIKSRLLNNNIADYETFTDYDSSRIIVRFPWKTGETEFDPVSAINELGETALLTFREGTQDPNGAIVLQGSDVDQASVGYDQEKLQYIVLLKLTSEGADKFSEATGRLVGKTISIFMDNECISYPTVNQQISGGDASISGNFTQEEAKELANKINSGALPFKLTAETYSTIDPSLGRGSLNAMLIAGIAAFALICIFMLAYYRIPGLVGCFSLLGQVAGSIAAVSGFFGFIPSFTLTVPGIAGIILSIGMGVDANIIVAERIKEEIRSGKTLDGSIKNGYDSGFSAIIDGNVTVVIVAIILMGSFGNPSGILSQMLAPIYHVISWVLSPFGLSIDAVTTGSIYSFGYTLLVGIIFNQIMGVLASRLMLTGISKMKKLRNPALYGGVKD